MNDELINSFRDFNRFYTAILGLVNNHILKSNYSLTEARVIYELAHSTDTTARKIKEQLQIDEGYMSRMIAGFQKNGMVYKEQSFEDKRIYLLKLTPKGREIAELIDKESDRQIENLISKLSKKERDKLIVLIAEMKAILS